MTESKKQQKERDSNFMHYLLALGIVAVVIFLAMNSGGDEEPMGEIAVFETTMGNFEIELDRENAPITVENFVNYINAGHFDGLIFHRVIPGFMVQGGGFTPDENQRATQAPIQLESQNGLKNVRGTVAMARSSVPNSATSQFFINVVDNEFLNYKPGNDGYAVFGKVTVGMDVADAIVNVPSGNRGPHQNWPTEDVVITKASMK